jgi:hypothetical protein
MTILIKINLALDYASGMSPSPPFLTDPDITI